MRQYFRQQKKKKIKLILKQLYDTWNTVGLFRKMSKVSNTQTPANWIQFAAKHTVENKQWTHHKRYRQMHKLAFKSTYAAKIATNSLQFALHQFETKKKIAGNFVQLENQLISIKCNFQKMKNKRFFPARMCMYHIFVTNDFACKNLWRRGYVTKTGLEYTIAS